ncbi:uncharacterized protein LOC126372240 [Pectinophora gossypiella]|uniref:uncharacterized protein LOC126372240 n=1 Tax=Pectinophora gossypiella TaxID=13191 RepID=UPI00214ECE65|nr:uncharacterized protein LOC126372240 [Pectinophora gossypiella]
MELLNQEEIHSIVKPLGSPKVLNWSIENYSDKLIGYLGDHLRLKIEIEFEGFKSELKLFVKCMPRFNEWKANYLKELTFFKKEYIMLSSLFKQFDSKQGTGKWCPKLLFVREDLFVFEDVAQLGYKMPCHLDTLCYDEVMAAVEAVARFHAQSFIYEERKSKEQNRSYRIWEDYSEYLKEPPQGQVWRDVGRNAVIDYLKVYSAHKPNFFKCLEIVIPMLFDGAIALMTPSSVYRNVVVHRDLWSNNIFFKNQDGNFHALIVDFQTVLYASPMLDLSSMLFFNTTRSFRTEYISEILDHYYNTVSHELKSEGIDIEGILQKANLEKAYEESIIFGITQAAIIVPIIAMQVEKREELFANPEKCEQINVVSRSAEFIEIGKEDSKYHARVIELFDEMVERYVFPQIVK